MKDKAAAAKKDNEPLLKGEGNRRRRWKGGASMTSSEEPILSIIIPAYNAEPYLMPCLNSLKEQDFQEFEVICVDDGSVDGTAGILECWAGDWTALSIYRQPHSGPGAARNLGMSKARGRYLYFMDSDDMLAPASLSYMVEAMEKERLDILAFGAEVFFENGRLERERYRDVQGFSYRKAYGTYGKGRELFCELAALGDFIPSACLMCFRHKFLRECKIRFPARLRCEDEVFCIEAWLNAGKSMHTDRKLYQRRVRDGSLMVTAASFDYVREAAGAVRDILELMREETEGSVKAAIRSHISRRAQEIQKRFEALPREEQECLHNLPPMEAAYDAFLLEMASVFRRAEAFYLFPWHLFRRGERVVIYGAGNVGRDFLRQVQEYGYVKLVGMADRAGGTAKIPGVEVKYPAELKDMEYDAILLSVQDGKLAESIREDLKKLGISEEKIRWDGQHYLRKDFYEGYYFPKLSERKESVED